jgi:hypothetical protein
MADGKTWTLGIAVTEKKPTVLYFFSVDQQLSMAPKEELQAQMDFLSGLYDTFGHDSLYIFGVTDEPKDELDWLGQAGYNKFAPLLDDGSNLHAALNIDLHPFIVVFDSAGTVIATCKTYRPGSYDLIEGRIRDAVASAKTTH